MILKISFVFLIIAWISPVYGKEPTNAIEWLLQTDDNKIESLSNTEDIKDRQTPNLIITTSNLKPIDLNSLGIIPSNITGIDTDIWRKVNEQTLYNELQSLPDLQFHSAQTFLKRVLISETNPPLLSKKSRLSGSLYLIARLDKLIKIGALDEAESLINQVAQINSDLFIRLSKISFLTGRLGPMCDKLNKQPSLSNDLSVRVICLSKLNDWNAAVLILSSAVSLNLLDKNREMLLINYLDPDVSLQTTLPFDYTNFDEIDFYLGNLAKNFNSKLTDSVKYHYASHINNNNLVDKILAAEALVTKKSISVSTLFDIYRSNTIEGSKGFWGRMRAIKNLDQNLERNNEQSVGIAIERTIEEMYLANLLFTLAPEYAAKLENFNVLKNRNDLNNAFAIIFALSGKVPTKWVDYQSKDAYIAKAFTILQNKQINKHIITEVIRLVDASFIQPNQFRSSSQNKARLAAPNKKFKVDSVLKALQESSAGVNTKTNHLYNSLLTLLSLDNQKLVKSILIEYLVHFSKLRA